MSKIIFKNRRGLRLAADLYRSSSHSIIILLHGFTGDRHEWERFDKLAEKLHSSGFNVLALDFSGCGESDDDPLTVEKQVDDLISTLEFTKKAGFKSVGVVGLSLGGLVALEGYRDQIQALVLWAPVTNKKSNYINRFDEEQRAELALTGQITKNRDEGVRKRIIIDKQMIRERENVDPETLLADIPIPILILHGDKDERVPLEDSENALLFLPSGSELKTVSRADHSFSNQLDQFINPTIEWFETHLPH